MLKAGRGGFDAEKICNTLECLAINMLFVIGGDGTQYAGHLLYEAARQRNLPVSIVGVPKSIDNDVLFIDRTFGFNTAVSAASTCIRNAWVEATSCEKGVGIVKLMGRDAGFICVNAALASNIVDLVMIPEVQVNLTDVLKYVDETIERKGVRARGASRLAELMLVAAGIATSALLMTSTLFPRPQRTQLRPPCIHAMPPRHPRRLSCDWRCRSPELVYLNAPRRLYYAVPVRI